MTALIVSHSSSLFHAAVGNRQELVLQRKAMLFLDSLIKKPGDDFGLACFDQEKKQALPVICPCHKLAAEIAKDQKYLRKIFLGGEILFERQPAGNNCLVLERLVAVKQDSGGLEKALLGVEVCA